METWSDVVSSYPEDPDPRVYGKALRSADIILSEDLAHFEIEWLAQTLFFKPIGLFDIIGTRWSNEDWQKNIADSFKILSKIVEKEWKVVEDYYNDIIMLCMLPFDPQTRKEAIHCLNTLAKKPSVDLSEEVVSRYVTVLEDATTCKAPLAQLVGTICRYHPEMVQSHFSRIWRIYLNMLQPNNKTDQLVNAVLQGINDLFEHFGDDIEISQLNGFYDKLSREFVKISRCLDVLLSILIHHGRLFKERLSKDGVLRMYLWQIETKHAMDALTNIYEVVLPEVENADDIIRLEVLPRTKSGCILTRHTAQRIILQAKSDISGVPNITNGALLEFQLRTKKLSYEEANTVAYCMESNGPNSETMLCTAIMFYENLPTSKRRDIVVNVLLKAPDHVRKAALVLLLKLSLQDDLDEYLDIWRVLLDNTSGPDLGKAVVIFEDALHHILEVLVTCIEDTDKVYADIKPILSLMATLLCLHKAELYTNDWCNALKPTVIHLSKLFQVSPLKILSEDPENSMTCVEKFQDNTVLSALLSSLNITEEMSSNETLTTLQKIFSNEDTDYKVLSKLLSRLEVFIESKNNNIDKQQLSMIINQILKLKSKSVINNKDCRTFQKDVAMFLGKYGHMIEKENFSNDVYVLQLKSKIVLNIPNVVQGTVLKIDLQRIYQLCLMWEDVEALYSLLVILSANLCDRSDPVLQEATIRVIHAIFRATGKKEVEICVYPALLMCNSVACVQRIMEAIQEDPCAIVRRKLSEGLEALLTHDPGSETTVQLLKIVAEQATFMISREDPSTILPGLDITRALLATLRDNNSLTVEFLPNILVYTFDNTEIFDIATIIFMEKVDLFNEEEINVLTVKIIEKYGIKYDSNMTLNYILGFFKKNVEIKKIDATFILNSTLKMLEKLTIISPQFLNLVALIAFLNSTFEFGIEIRRSVASFQNGFLLKELIKIEFDEDDDLKMIAVLVFLREFALELKEIDSEKSLECLGNVIENLPPKSVLPLKRNLSDCLSVYKIESKIPSIIVKRYEKWYEKLILKSLTEQLEENILFNDFTENISEIIHALKIMSVLFEIPVVETRNWTALILKNMSEMEQKWGKIFLSDLLVLSERYLSDNEFDEMLRESRDFVEIYISVYFQRLIRKPFVLNAENNSLIVDIVEYFSKNYKEEYFQNVLDLVEYVWPDFEKDTNFDDKLSLLVNLMRLPKKVGLDCPAVDWAITLLTAEGTSLEDRHKIIALLPAGEEYGTYYRTFASCLPVRLSEMQGQYIAPFRVLLDSLAANGDMTLLDIVITLAGGDETPGWWDNAIDFCMKTLAAKEDRSIYDKVFRRAKADSTMGVCNRIFLPLLRHSSRKFCATYISSIVKSDLFSVLRMGIEPANNEVYRKRVVSYAIAFNILKVAFEKIPSDFLESGTINENAGSVKPWYFLEESCKLCVTVSAKVKCPMDANEDLKKACLWLQCAAYNCLSIAVRRRKLSKKLCTFIFNVQTWTRIVDKDAVYPFELKAYARYKGSKPLRSRSLDAMAMSSAFTGTMRSRLFLTTLSENPLQYDMIPNDEDMEEEEEDTTLEIEESVLNAHGCVTALSCLLEHASTAEHTEWRTILTTALTSDLNVNAKWLLAQAICNAEEALKPHASALCPALFALISTTSSIKDGKPVLNDLHIEILSTIIKWNFADLQQDANLDCVVKHLIFTCILNKQRLNIYRRLLNVLNEILHLYGKIVKVNWNIFQDYCQDLSKDIISLLPIFERLLKNSVKLPDILTAIFASPDVKNWTGSSRLAEVCGLALSSTDSVTRDGYLIKFWQILNNVRGVSTNNYVKILFYAQKHCKECCDFQNFKTITDLATKIEKSKCLTILATYLENSRQFDDYYNDMLQIISLTELLESELRVEAMKIARNCLSFIEEEMRHDVLKAVALNCRNTSHHVRREAFSVVVKAFQDLVKPEDQNSSKRKAVDSSRILDIMNSENDLNKLLVSKIFDGIFDRDENISKMVSDAVEELVSEHITIRFAELFYLIIYQCSLAKTCPDLPNCGSKLLQILFSDVRRQEAFNILKLRDDPLPQSIMKAYEVTLTKTYARTITRTGVTFRQRMNKTPVKRDIDVQMPLTDILGVFLQVSKMNSQFCQELCVQIMKCLQGTGRRFDLDASMCKQLHDIIKREPNCLTPLVLDACRIFVEDINCINGFKESLELLKSSASNSEGYLYTSILYEDLLLRTGDRTHFIFRIMKDDTDEGMRNQEFSLDGLINIFGLLSNWDDLRVQEKRQIEESLPPLWTKNEDFSTSLRQYFEGANKKLDCSLWFNKMVAAYYQEEVVQDKISWLKQTEKWPRRDFVTSAVMEAIQWNQHEIKHIDEINSSDCLAEWAARLMIRSAYNTCNQNSDSEGPSYSTCRDELVWCVEANRRRLPTLALQCIERNKESLLDVEILPWVQEKVKAYRTIGLKDNNNTMLQKALEAAEKQSTKCASLSSFETNVNIQTLVLQLHYDLKSISNCKIKDVIQEVSKHHKVLCHKSKVLKTFYETAMMIYDEQWIEDDEAIQNEIILGMIHIIDKIFDYNLAQDYNLLFCVIFNRIMYDTIVKHETAKLFLEQVSRVMLHLDSFSVAIIKKIVAVLPATVVDENYIKLQDAGLDVCKEYFQLICDANYSLLQYCNELRKNILDETEWKKTYNLMKHRIFQTKYGGSDYQSLNSMKNRLFALENMADIDSKAKELKVIIDELKIKPQRANLRLSQLCPDLCSAAILEGRRADVQRILRLPPNVYIVKFFEQVIVFTDSIRRPCVLRALLSTGVTRQYICKSGEPMYRDAAVQRSAAILSTIDPGIKVRSYNVTPLSDDSAIIEYLEDHVRLRDLMEEKHDINNIGMNRTGFDKLVLAPSLAIEQFNEMCDKVTPYILRSSIENKCSCVEEFIIKKRNFEDTLSAMTIVNWLFGVGDRHLQNIMYSTRDGSVCGVDWASIFQYGCQELPPARLTANLLAVCDVKVLESRLQATLSSLRESKMLFEAFVRTSFYWLAPGLSELKPITRILEGKAVSYEITREIIDESNKKYKNDYIKLLDQVFENFSPKEAYSVEEQVSCLLQHCTDPRILSVTPPGWEAWL